MPARNTDADSRIVEAATAEFLEKSYNNASLRTIAAQAGITTGALFRRYESKDDLFCSLTQCVVDDVLFCMQDKTSAPIAHGYAESTTLPS